MRKLRSVRVIKFVALTLLAMVVVAPPTGADSTGSVTATVTANTACITVGASTVDFGSLPFSAEGNNTVEFGLPDAESAPEYTLTNCSSAEASFEGTGNNVFEPSSGAIVWYLDDSFTSEICADTSSLTGGYTGATDRFYSSVITDTNGTGVVGDATPTGDSGMFLANGVSKPLAGASAVAGLDSIIVGNRITMPCTGSSGAGTTHSMSITYTALLNS